MDTWSIEVGAQLGRDELKSETKVSHGKERSYLQENCYALELTETNNVLQAHLWRVGDANTVTPPSRFTLQVIVRAPCGCHQMEVTADLDMNSGSEKAYGSWRPVPLTKGESVLLSTDFANWSAEYWKRGDKSELIDARYVLSRSTRDSPRGSHMLIPSQPNGLVFGFRYRGGASVQSNTTGQLTHMSVFCSTNRPSTRLLFPSIQPYYVTY